MEVDRERARLFGEHIAAAARLAGYNLDSPRSGGRAALAEAIGMSPASASRLLAGQTIPEAYIFERLAKHLALPLGELFVLAGITSIDPFSPEAQVVERRIDTPAQAAAALGIVEPWKVKLFISITEAILVAQHEREA